MGNFMIDKMMKQMGIDPKKFQEEIEEFKEEYKENGLNFINTFKEKTFKLVNKSKHEPPKYETSGSAGMDIRASIDEPISILPNDRALIPTGLYIELRDGYEAQIRPRSGLAVKKGIMVVNSPGTIDSDFRGEIHVIMYNSGNEPFIVNNGDRIAQMVINKYERVNWEVVTKLSETQRESGGFGSTGTK